MPDNNSPADDPIALFNRGAYEAAAAQLLPLYRDNTGNSLLALFAGAALSESGSRDEALAVWSLGDEAGAAVRGARNDPQAPPDIRALSAGADQALRAHFTSLHASASAQCEGEGGRIRNAIWTQTHDRPFRFKTEGQAPTIFYVPDLPAAPVTATSELPWAAGLEAAGAAIAKEYAAAIEQNVQQKPYVPAETIPPEWAALRGTLDWSALHLFDKAKRTALADIFPTTLRALQDVDLVMVDGAPVEVFFSRLRPGAHIPPHYGLTNARLTVHLPLIVPDNCAIRVVGADYRWRPHELIAFDDSYLHEAWNRSPSDRVVLIFECHHPDLTPVERAAVEHTWSARQQWLDDRLPLIGAA